ncbi:MAG: hypothetical protein ABUT20_42190 [Bacteroidota bacterium]
MSKSYFIHLTLKSDEDVECFAKFNLGQKRELATSLFRQLKGSRNVSEKDVLHMEFIEMENDLPLSIDMIACTLADIGENSKTITRELFKSKLL